MNGFLYRQKGTDRNVPRGSIPGLMVRHLQYITTRPGAVYNPECGFSLWGSINSFQPPENIANLDSAKTLLRQEAERGRSIFRAVISIGEPDARECGYYDREKWEPMINDQVSNIAQGMGIQPGDFRWLASMHVAEGHPHVHLVFWDGGKEPRREFMPPQKFKAYSNSIRQGLNRFAWGQDIKTAQAEQAKMTKELRMEIRAMCLDCNPGGGLNVKGLYKDEETLQELSQRLTRFVDQLPNAGSLKYAYLPPYLKNQLDEVITILMELPQYREQLEKYKQSTLLVSRLYGNTEDEQQEKLKNAMNKLYRNLGNDLLNNIRPLLDGLEMNRCPEEIHQLAQEAVERIDPEQSQHLLSLLPPDRIPWKEMLSLPEFREALDNTIAELLQDNRVVVGLREYAATLGDGAGNWVQEKWAQEVEQILCRQLRWDKGYYFEQSQTQAVTTACYIFNSLCRLVSQNQAVSGLNAMRLHSRDKSREAQRDMREKHRQGNDWTPEI